MIKIDEKRRKKNEIIIFTAFVIMVELEQTKHLFIYAFNFLFLFAHFVLFNEIKRKKKKHQFGSKVASFEKREAKDTMTTESTNTKNEWNNRNE